MLMSLLRAIALESLLDLVLFASYYSAMIHPLIGSPPPVRPLDSTELKSRLVWA